MEALSMISFAMAAFRPAAERNLQSAWWRRFVQSLGRRLRALAAERRRRRTSNTIHNFDPVTSVFHRASIGLCECAHAMKE
jgi:hypothetical protein